MQAMISWARSAAGLDVDIENTLEPLRHVSTLAVVLVFRFISHLTLLPCRFAG
uniref:Uncharacterized protein n=1 Tax=Salmonella enterica subsp. enterica serovar London TaxID=149390 RepID=A0A3G8EXW1_SALET|nr:hypothetical protein KADIGFNM_00233 [Salmonella enterica subsp. enterica serovar London]AZF85737.1 hypothetical protein KADIGFNM_00400 [Salmonella enterica subsp. enterica serovar London]